MLPLVCEAVTGTPSLQVDERLRLRLEGRHFQGSGHLLQPRPLPSGSAVGAHPHSVGAGALQPLEEEQGPLPHSEEVQGPLPCSVEGRQHSEEVQGRLLLLHSEEAEGALPHLAEVDSELRLCPRLGPGGVHQPARRVWLLLLENRRRAGDAGAGEESSSR